MGCACAVLGAFFALTQAVPTTWEMQEIARLTASDAVPYVGQDFGCAVAIWGRYIVVGARDDYHVDVQAGAVYVFEFADGSWVERAKLIGSGTGLEDQLGWSVALDGDVLVAGAPHFTTFGTGLEGAAYVFRRHDSGTPEYALDDIWLEEARLKPAQQIAGDGFGGSVAVAGDLVTIGAAGSGLEVVNRAYVFRHADAWVEEGVLVGSDTQWSDEFGRSIAISGDVVLVGAPGHDGACPTHYPDCNSGAVYVFAPGDAGWIQTGKLVLGDDPIYAWFGRSLTAYAGGAVVGAGNAAYVWRNGGGWTEERSLTPYPDEGTRFGAAVSASGLVALVGDPFDSTSAPRSGSAYLFRIDGGETSARHKLVPSDRSATYMFGKSVSVDGAYALVGGASIESAYVYSILGNRLDLADYAQFETCMQSDVTAGKPECAVLDLVPDGKVDNEDYVQFVVRFTGP